MSRCGDVGLKEAGLNQEREDFHGRRLTDSSSALLIYFMHYIHQHQDDDDSNGHDARDVDYDDHQPKTRGGVLTTDSMKLMMRILTAGRHSVRLQSVRKKRKPGEEDEGF